MKAEMPTIYTVVNWCGICSVYYPPPYRAGMHCEMVHDFDERMGTDKRRMWLCPARMCGEAFFYREELREHLEYNNWDADHAYV